MRKFDSQPTIHLSPSVLPWEFSQLEFYRGNFYPTWHYRRYSFFRHTVQVHTWISLHLVRVHSVVSTPVYGITRVLFDPKTSTTCSTPVSPRVILSIPHQFQNFIHGTNRIPVVLMSKVPEKSLVLDEIIHLSRIQDPCHVPQGTWLLKYSLWIRHVLHHDTNTTQQRNGIIPMALTCSTKSFLYTRLG